VRFAIQDIIVYQLVHLKSVLVSFLVGVACSVESGYTVNSSQVAVLLVEILEFKVGLKRPFVITVEVFILGRHTVRKGKSWLEFLYLVMRLLSKEVTIQEGGIQRGF